MTASQGFPLAGRRVYIAGHRGMAGSAIARRLASENCTVLTAERAEVDLARREPTERWFAQHRPDVVVLAAAKVGGINANDSLPVDFLADNLAIELNVIRASHANEVKRLLFLGSTCIYPRLAQQPMSEDQLLTGPLEPTNEWYGVAKIAGIKLCQAYRRQYGNDYIAVMPTNLFGPGDNYHPEHSHVVAALIRRIHEAKVAGSSEVVVWGTGTPRREFLHVDDMADACVFLLKTYSGADIVNIGRGDDITIADFAQMIADVVGYRGALRFDTSRPDGTPRKLVDVSRLTRLGWTARIGLRDGLAATYASFLAGQGRNVG